MAVGPDPDNCSAPPLSVALVLPPAITGLACRSAVAALAWGLLCPALAGAGLIPLTCDVSVGGTLTATQRDSIVFEVQEGEIVELVLDEVDPVAVGFALEWLLLDASGTPVGDCGVPTRVEMASCGPLSAAGSPYLLEVYDYQASTGGGYRAHLQRLTAAARCDAVALGCDSVATSTIEDPEESDLFEFTVEDGALVQVAVQELSGAPPAFVPYWRIVDGAGNPAPDCGTYSFLSLGDCGPLPAAGNPWAVEVHDLALDATGGVGVHVQVLNAAAACDTTSIPCDQPLTRNLDSSFDSDLYAIALTADERIDITVDEVGGTAGFLLEWRLLDSNGIPTPDCGTLLGEDNRICGPLAPAGAPYLLQVQDRNFDASGTYSVHLQRLTPAAVCDETPIFCGIPLHGTFESAIDDDLLRFDVPSPQIFHVTTGKEIGLPAGFNVQWRILDAQGAAATDCGTYTALPSLDCGPLDPSGSPYRLQVAEEGHQFSGGYIVHLQTLGAGAACDQQSLSCGTYVTGSLDFPQDNDLLEFSTLGGETLLVYVDKLSGTSAFDPVWRLVDGDGNPASVCGEFTADSPDSCGPLLATGAPYRIEVRDGSNNASGEYRAAVSCVTTSAPPVPPPDTSALGTPQRLELRQNHPNPFNPSTTLGFALAERGRAVIEVFDAAGARVATLVDGELGAGEHQITWDARGLPSGVYLCRLRAGAQTSVRKLALLR